MQEEAGNSQDSNVAQVFRNRLAEGSPYPRLQSNTSSYIQSDADNNYLWNWVAPYYGGWDNIPENIVSAYDTYHTAGLTPGPISNPGIAAIRAALSPEPDEAKDAYFFVTDPGQGPYLCPAPQRTQRQLPDRSGREQNGGVTLSVKPLRVCQLPRWGELLSRRPTWSYPLKACPSGELSRREP